jgi:hypothetical protein
MSALQNPSTLSAQNVGSHAFPVALHSARTVQSPTRFPPGFGLYGTHAICTTFFLALFSNKKMAATRRLHDTLPPRIRHLDEWCMML